MKKAILVVDDEPDLEMLVRQKFRKKIKDEELKFIFAADGVDALAKLKENRDIALVLSDINMPRMDGLTLIREIGNLDSLKKVVIVSAYGDMQNIRTAMNLGAFDFLTKPIDFKDLEITIYKTIEYVEEAADAQKKLEELSAIKHELDLARAIQESILPDEVPRMPGLEVQALYLPASRIGGDYYDFHIIGKKGLNAILTDVAGHGVPAALIASMVKIAYTLQEENADKPELVNDYINETLVRVQSHYSFCTSGCVHIDLEKSVLTYSSAGHPSLFIWKRATREIQAVQSRGAVLGVFPSNKFGSVDTPIEKGDRIILYSDCITESRNPDGEFFGNERFKELIKEKHELAASDFIASVVERLKDWTGLEDSFEDDLTLVVIDIQDGRAPEF